MFGLGTVLFIWELETVISLDGFPFSLYLDEIFIPFLCGGGVMVD